MDNSQVLVGSGRQGDFVHSNQEMAKSDGFRNVSRIWRDKCVGYDAALDKIASDKRTIEDIKGPLFDFIPAVNAAGNCVLRYKDGREFQPTPFALKHIAVMGRTSEWFLTDLTEDKYDTQKPDKLIFKRDAVDGGLMVNVLQSTIFRKDRVDQNKVRLFRTWNNGTLRAVLSDQYAIVNNGWMIETMRDLIPGGLVSHWRGDADSIYANILIPDTIRAESDSDYGGMLSIGNSEIGMRRVSSCPSVFRAICMNGCIWDQTVGQSTRKWGWDGASAEQLFTQLGGDFKLGKKAIAGIYKAYQTELDILGKEAATAFGVINAVTRYGQTLENQALVDSDEKAGDIVNFGSTRWNSMVSRAKTLDSKEIEKAGFALAV